MNRGFVALTLVITVSSLLLAFTYILSIETAHFFDQTERKEYRLMGYYFAYSCIDQAILSLSHDYFYQISEPKGIPDLHCSIDVVKDENGFKKIEVHGNYKNIIVKRRAFARLYDNRVELISIN